MRRGLALLLISGVLLAACSSPRPAPRPKPAGTIVPAGMVSCDDGGSGGVIIDGVCL